VNARENPKTPQRFFAVEKVLARWPPPLSPFSPFFLSPFSPSCLSPFSHLDLPPRTTPTKRKKTHQGHENELKAGDVIRCRECGYRILYKKRTKRVVQFEAR
jgi:DNA-directed RNA polymerase subunit RPC12/RpoP